MKIVAKHFAIHFKKKKVSETMHNTGIKVLR